MRLLSCIMKVFNFYYWQNSVKWLKKITFCLIIVVTLSTAFFAMLDKQKQLTPNTSTLETKSHRIITPVEEMFETYNCAKNVNKSADRLHICGDRTPKTNKIVFFTTIYYTENQFKVSIEAYLKR